MQPHRITAARRSTRRGFSIIELLIVFVIAAIITAIGVPRFNYMRETSNMRSAKAQITSAVATARATAIRRSGAAEVRRAGSRLVVVTGTDTVVRPILLDSLYKVTLEVAPDVVRYDPRGLATLDSTVKFVFTRAGHRDSVCVTRVGAVMREGCLP